jgi:hypothetical protein
MLHMALGLHVSSLLFIFNSDASRGRTWQLMLLNRHKQERTFFLVSCINIKSVSKSNYTGVHYY